MQTIQLPHLQSGNNWLEFMIANGWTLSESFTGGDIDHVELSKEGHQLEYYNSDRNGSSFRHHRFFAGKWVEWATIRGADIEADLGRFMFLAHTMGWVSLPAALKLAAIELEKEGAA